MSNLQIFKSKIGISESQRYEPGINQFDNCGPAAVSAIMQVYGYPDIEPQDLAGANYRGGTTIQQLQSYLKRYSNPPSTTITGALVTQLPSIALFRSNSAAQLITYNDGIFHWSVPLEDDGSGITIWNTEWGIYERYTYNFIHQSFVGTSLVFNRPFPLRKDSMFLRNETSGAIAIIGVEGYRHISADEWPLWSANGTTFQNVDDATFNKVLSQIPRAGGA